MLSILMGKDKTPLPSLTQSQQVLFDVSKPL